MTNYFCNVLCDFSFIYQVTGFLGGFFCKSINAVILFVFLYYLKIIIQNVLIYQKGENAKNIFKELLLD